MRIHACEQKCLTLVGRVFGDLQNVFMVLLAEHWLLAFAASEGIVWKGSTAMAPASIIGQHVPTRRIR